MALEDMKIKEKDFIGKDVSSLPIHPSADGMGAVELQAAFDRAVKEVIVPKFNALLEEMPHLTKLLASTELTSEDFLHYANDTNTGFTISALLELSRQHRASMENPHAVTKEQIGLGSVDNTSDLNKPVSTAVQAALDNLYETKIKPVEAGGNLEPRVSSLEKQVTDNKSVCDQKLNGIDNRVETNNKNIKGVETSFNAFVNQSNQKTQEDDKLIGTLVATQNELKSSYTTLEETQSGLNSGLSNHIGNKSNPHKVTAEQVGLGNIPSRVDALERQLPRVMAKTAFDALPEKDASVVYILT